MNDRQLDALVAWAAVTDEEVAELDLADVDTDLREAIIATQRDAEVAPVRAAGGGRRPRFLAVAAAVAAAALALVVIQPVGRDSGTAWAEALVEAAEASPLVLVNAPGWEVTRADVYGDGIGEMTFRDGSTELTLYWRDRDSFDRWLESRGDSAEHREQLTVLGHEATLFKHTWGDPVPDGGSEFITLYRDSQNTIEIRGYFPSIEAYRTVLSSLEHVDVDTWLSAMPQSVIAPADRAAVVREMLADIPQPEGFDAAALEDGPLRARYHLGARVAGAVACAWIEQWVQATDSGDAEAANEAAEAMRGSTDWNVLREMNPSGDYPEVLWEYAEAINGDGTVMGGVPSSVEESYEAGLGCSQ